MSRQNQIEIMSQGSVYSQGNQNGQEIEVGQKNYDQYSQQGHSMQQNQLPQQQKQNPQYNQEFEMEQVFQTLDLPTMQQQPNGKMILPQGHLPELPCSVTCPSCKKKGITIVKQKACNINCFCWFLFFNIFGACGYACCCKSAHGINHYCYSCDVLIYSQKSKCCP